MATQNREYWQKLRDPRWQKMRLEIMQRDEFACQICFATERTLNVHHNYYESGKEPWEYPTEALVTLCEECHTEETEQRRGEEQLLLAAMRQCGMRSSHINSLAAGIHHTFGEIAQFPDRWDMKLYKLLLHFHSINYEDILQVLNSKRGADESVSKL